MIHQPHPFGNHSAAPFSLAGDNPLREAPQNSFGKRWCLVCQDMRPTKGGSMKNGFRCALHQAKGAQQ